MLSLDRRSHGASDLVMSGQRMARHGKDLHDFLAALDLSDVVLVGGSMGGSTVWACGHGANTDHPEAFNQALLAFLARL